MREIGVLFTFVLQFFVHMHICLEIDVESSNDQENVLLIPSYYQDILKNIPSDNISEEKDNYQLRLCCKTQYSWDDGRCIPPNDKSSLEFPKWLTESFSNWTINPNVHCKYGTSKVAIALEKSHGLSNKQTRSLGSPFSLNMETVVAGQKYCVDSVQEDSLTYFVCKKEISGFVEDKAPTPILIKKCCLPNQYAAYINNTEGENKIVCLNDTNLPGNWTPKVYIDPWTLSPTSSQFQFRFQINGISCPLKNIKSIPAKRFRVLENGQAIVCGGVNPQDQSSEIVWFVYNSEFCMDQIKNSDPSIINGFQMQDTIFLCESNFTTRLSTIKTELRTIFFAILHERFESAAQVTGIVCIISAIFLACALTVYLILWNIHNIHGWTQFSFLLSLFCCYLISGSRRLLGYEELRRWKIAVLFEALEDFSAVSVSANLVALSFDLFFVLWNNEPTLSKYDGRKRFGIITAIAWSSGVLVMIIGLILKTNSFKEIQNYEEVQQLAEYIPKLLEFFLCIQNDMLLKICLPIVQLGLFSVNLILFITSVYVLYRKKVETRAAYENIAKKEIVQIWIRRYTKLFVVMGLWWPIIMICIFECINMKKFTMNEWLNILKTFYKIEDLEQQQIREENSNNNNNNNNKYNSMHKNSEIVDIPLRVYVVSNLLTINAILISILFVFNNKKIWQALKKKVQLWKRHANNNRNWNR